MSTEVEEPSRQRQGELRKKEFVARNSLLTDLFQSIKHFRTIEHIIVTALFYMAASTVLSDYLEKGSMEAVLSPHVNFLHAAFENYQIAIVVWVKLILLAFTFFPIVWFLARIRKCGPAFTIFDLLSVVIYLCYQTFFVMTTYDMFFRNPIFGPATALAVSAEQLRLIAKMHSFVREVSRKIFANPTFESKKNDGDPMLTKCTTPQFPSFGQYSYFLFAPTLVYRDEYPRTPAVKWGQVAFHFLQFFGCVLCYYWIVVFYLVSEFTKYSTAQSEVTSGMMILTLIRGAVPTGIMYLLFFYGFFQSWHNAWAELLRFGDRLFYTDWWNADDFGDYLRRWNLIVHDWLYVYVYKESYDLLGHRGSKVIPSILVFAVSAIFHEYYTLAVLRFFFPIMTINLFGGNILIYAKMGKRGRFNNFYLWQNVFFAWGAMSSLYLFEAAARMLCPNAAGDNFDNAFLAAVTPRFPSCFGTS